MFIIYCNTLQSVYLLYLVNKILLQFLWSENTQNVLRISGTIHQRFSCHNPVTLMNIYVFTLGYEIFFHITCFILYNNPSHPFYITAKFNGAVYLTYNRLFLRFSGLEKLGNPGQAACNIFSLCSFTRYLCQHIAGMNNIAFLERPVISSTSSFIVTPSTMSPNAILPPTSVRIGIE